jgi:hypothetical protein
MEVDLIAFVAVLRFNRDSHDQRGRHNSNGTSHGLSVPGVV